MVLVTVAQAAERACVSESLIYEWIAAGTLACYRLGKPGKRGCVRIAVQDLEAFLASCRVEGTTEDDEPLRHIR
jgi:excisionase family DNA binding protein